MTPESQPGPVPKAMMLAGVASVAIGAVVGGRRDRDDDRDDEPERVELVDVQEAE